MRSSMSLPIIRNRDRLIGMGKVVLTRYERVCFEKELDQRSWETPGHVCRSRTPAFRCYHGHYP